jgi:hypothetical protein
MTERDPIKRFNNLLNWLEKQKDDSPFDQASWDELMDENVSLRTDMAVARKEFKQLKLIHEDCASKLFDLQQSYQKLNKAHDELTQMYLQQTNS